MRDFVSGALTTGYLVAALFFLRFHQRTRDRLFGLFALSFGLLAVQRFALTAAIVSGADRAIWPYVLRLAAFAIILFAIWDKNRAR